MAVNFPASLDTLTNPTATDYLNSPSHSAQHANANDIIEALEAKVGVDSSAVVTSHDYLLRHLPTQLADLAMGTKKITGMGDPSAAQDAATMNYVDTQIATQTSKSYVTPVIKKWDGWNTVSDAWSYASATTITVPSGAASLYQKGDKIKLTQTTVKYFIIVSVADTVLTVTGGADYTVANAAISAIGHSKMNNPAGFPVYFNIVPTWTNQPGSPTANKAVMKVTDGICFIHGTVIFPAGTNASPLSAEFPFVPDRSWEPSSADEMRIGMAGAATTEYVFLAHASAGRIFRPSSVAGTAVTGTVAASKSFWYIAQFPIT